MISGFQKTMVFCGKPPQTIGIFFANGVFRFGLRDGRHDCVFNNQYLSPNLDDVYSSLKKLMDKLYEK